MDARRVVILGVGNVLLRDEGVGVHVARALLACPPQAVDAHIEIYDAGTSADLAYLSSDADLLIIIDAAQLGQVPGAVSVFDPQEIGCASNAPLSLHDRGIYDALAEIHLMALHPPRMLIVGIEPQTVEWGIGLSPAVADAIPKVLATIEHHISRALAQLSLETGWQEGMRC